MHEGGAAGGANHRRARADRLQRLQLLEVTLGPAQPAGQLSSPVTCCQERTNLSAGVGDRRRKPRAVERVAIQRELLRVRVRQLSRQPPGCDL